jgi:hypothetical protein
MTDSKPTGDSYFARQQDELLLNEIPEPKAGDVMRELSAR